MRKMCITAVQLRRSLTHGTNARYIRPYLLRNLKIDHPGQVWSIDITYIPMEKGFMCMTAIIDVYSRAIVALGLHNTHDGATSIIKRSAGHQVPNPLPQRRIRLTWPAYP